jgi:uncharacterized protein (UPF0218 family)
MRNDEWKWKRTIKTKRNKKFEKVIQHEMEAKQITCEVLKVINNLIDFTFIVIWLMARKCRFSLDLFD